VPPRRRYECLRSRQECLRHATPPRLSGQSVPSRSMASLRRLRLSRNGVVEGSEPAGGCWGQSAMSRVDRVDCPSSKPANVGVDAGDSLLCPLWTELTVPLRSQLASLPHKRGRRLGSERAAHAGAAHAGTSAPSRSRLGNTRRRNGKREASGVISDKRAAVGALNPFGADVEDIANAFCGQGVAGAGVGHDAALL